MRCLSEDLRGRFPVEVVEHERPRQVQRPAREEQLVVELLCPQSPVCAGQMQERPLAPAVYEHDGRRSRDGLVYEDAAAVDSALVEQPDQELSERVRSDLPRGAGPETEPDQGACRV